MSTDNLRFAAITAARQKMRELETNAIARNRMWEIVSAALDGYEDQMAIDLHESVRTGWAIILDGKPILIVPTRRIARQQRKILATLARRPRYDFAVVSTEVAVVPCGTFEGAVILPLTPLG